MSTIPEMTREEKLRRIVHVMSEQVEALGLHLAPLYPELHLDEATRNRLVEEMCECIACSRRRARGEA